MLNKYSLYKTIDNLNNAFFFGEELAEKDKLEVGQFIASRQGLPRSYAGMFAPTEEDSEGGVRLFTGEQVKSGAATGHILGEETCRVLIQLGIKDKNVKDSLRKATDNFLNVLKGTDEKYYSIGMFCCGTCTPAYWRHLSVGGLDMQEERLSKGMEQLKQHRNDKGRWRRFPFWWTALALSEMESDLAGEELNYIAPSIERGMKRLRKDVFGNRKRALAERILARC